jgi:PAS domain S-box-containing protein
MKKWDERKFVTAIMLGLFGFLGMHFCLNLKMPTTTISVYWSLCLPLLAALAYGWRYGLLAALVGGGAYFPFMLWPDNGWANVLNTLMYASWLGLHGLAGEKRRTGGAWLWNAYFIQLLWSLVVAALIMGLYPPLFSLNPPFWCPQASKTIAVEILQGITLKDILVLFLQLALAKALLTLPWVRTVLGDSAVKKVRSVWVLPGSVLAGFLFWFALVGLESFWKFGDIRAFPQVAGQAHQMLWLLLQIGVCLVAGTQLIKYMDERNEAELKLSQLAQVVEQASEDVVLTDLEGMILYANPATQRNMGYGLDEIKGKKTSVFKSGRHNAAFYAHLWGELISGRVYKGRLINRAKDGREVVQDVVIAPFFNTRGQAQGYVSMRRDVSEQVLMEARAAQAQKLEAVGALAGGIAHDFNNILAAVAGYLDLSLEGELENGLRQNLGTARQATRRGMELVHQILTFSQQGQNPAPMAPVHLKPIIQEALKFLRASLPSTVEIWPEMKDDVVVMGDRVGLHRVMINLGANAALALRGTGGTVKVVLEAFDMPQGLTGMAAGPCAHWQVTDTGCGMSEAVKARIFEPFFSTRSAGEGTGLGLSVVHGIIESFHGSIQVESQPGQGSTFHIYLPLAQEAPIAPARTEQGLGLVKGQGSILFVDDEPDLVNLARQRLGMLGYDVKAVCNGAEALHLFRQNPKAFDLLITDMIMPGMTGMVLAASCRALKSDLPVIVCTGYSESLDAQRVQEAGLNGLVLKPVDWPAFSHQIKKLLQKENHENSDH